MRSTALLDNGWDANRRIPAEYGLNGGESPVTFPSTLEGKSFPTSLQELARAGLCPACAIEIPLAHYSGPAPVSQLPAFTESEIDEALAVLDEQE